MNLTSWIIRRVPDWLVVMGLSGLVGAVSAILAVVLYRDVTRDDADAPIAVPSKSNDGTN